jgi:ribosomal protein S18 acetylase RimI-like enzyme
VPNDDLRIVSASSVSLAEFAAAFTAGFGGYAIPVVLDAVRLSRRVRQDQYDLENSLVAYEGGEVLGVAVLAVRADVGWVAGLGVVPARRGRGRGRLLLAALLERARRYGLRSLRLEVLTHNNTARRIYEDAGMRVVRDLLLLGRAGGGGDAGAGGAAGADAGKAAAGRSAETGEPELKEAAPAELLSHFARLHAAPPQWSRGLPSLLVKAGMRGFYTGERAHPDAYALLTKGDDGVIFLSDLAAADAVSARALCAALVRLVAGPLSVINEPEHSLFIAPLLEHGFAETERQHEMLIEM